jgi:hypothetical protein
VFESFNFYKVFEDWIDEKKLSKAESDLTKAVAKEIIEEVIHD